MVYRGKPSTNGVTDGPARHAREKQSLSVPGSPDWARRTTTLEDTMPVPASNSCTTTSG